MLSTIISKVFDILCYCYENMLPLFIARFFYVAIIISANLKNNLIIYAVVTNIYANFFVDNKVVNIYIVAISMLLLLLLIFMLIILQLLIARFYYILFIICANFCCSW